MNKTYFDTPTQVKFWNGGEEGYLGGIAFKDQIICMCCGGIIEISDIMDWAKEDGLEGDPIIELSWINISSEMIGE